MAHTTHWNTHVHIWRRHRTHTHTHAGKPEIAVNLVSAFSHPGLSLDCEVNCPSLVRDGHVFCYFACFFCWGSYWRKPLVNTGRTCKLHTERPGRVTYKSISIQWYIFNTFTLNR